MDQPLSLREIVARLCRVDAAAVGPDFSLAALVQSSLSVHLLDSALRRHLGAVPPALGAVRTYGELEAALAGVPAAAAPATNPASAAPGRVACGLDLERVSNLPEATDYWT